jgi:hypothetical protein
MRFLSLVLAALLTLTAAGRAASDDRDETTRLMDEAAAAVDRGDQASGRALMEQAAATGHPEAINGFATYVNMGIGADPDPARARGLFEKAAAAGSIGAKLNLGLALIDSDLSADQKRAVELLSDLHSKPPGDAGKGAVRMLAAGGLAKAYLFGIGVDQDIERGVDLLEEADGSKEAEAGVLFLLGRTFESGWGGRERDSEKAYGYFLRAAQGGHAASQWNVGMALLNGSGVERNEREAYRWVRKAAEAGETRAEISTAVMLALGQGVAENDAEARLWYERAATRNSAHALRGLGFMLLNGEGGPREAARGHAYVRLAADAGEPAAKRLLTEFPPSLDAAERTAADEIAAKWLREHGAPVVVD